MNPSDRKDAVNPFGKLTFLVVDDFENFRLSMRQMLCSCGADKIELVAHATPAIQIVTQAVTDQRHSRAATRGAARWHDT